MPWSTSRIHDGAPHYTSNFAPASYSAAVPYIDTRRDTEQIQPVHPRVVPRPPPSADSYSGALNSKNNMPTTTTGISDTRTHRNTERIPPAVPLVAPRPASNADSHTGPLNSNNHRSNATATATVPDNRTHRIAPAVPPPTSNAVGSASISVTDGLGSGEFREFQEKKGPETTIDRSAQHCTFARQHIEALISRLDDKLGDVHQQRFDGWLHHSCPTTAREKQQQQQQQEKKEEGQCQSEVKQLLRQLQQQLHQQFQHTQEMSGKLARMDERPWLVKTQELQQTIDSLQEEIKQLKLERQMEWVRAEKVAEEGRLKQSQEADRVKQLEAAMRRLTHLEHQVNVETGAVSPDQVERDWLLVNQRGIFEG